MKTNYQQFPDARGHFGQYGGRFVSETLIDALDELNTAYQRLKNEPEFQSAFDYDLAHYVGRPSPLYFAQRWTQQLGGAQIYLKREDLNHTGAHKINNTVGQALLAKHMGKKRIIAETGAGQHGVASATIAARLGLECVVFMGAEDIERQALNVYRMKLLGAKVVAVSSGSKTLKDAMNEAMRDWVTNVDDTFYMIGTAAGPHPYPQLVRDFQSVIGREARQQCLEMTGRLPDTLVACVGGGSNAIGLFHPFLADEQVEIIGVEAGGHGLETGQHAAPLSKGEPGVLHGNRTYLMSDEDGQIMHTHSISAGLDYPGVGPEHAWLKDIERAQYVAVNDDAVMDAFHELTRIEGIMPALESSHALAYAKTLAPSMDQDKIIIVNLSGRGDKDIHTVAKRANLSFAEFNLFDEKKLKRSMSRITSCLKNLEGANKKALIPYVVCGDPHLDATVDILHGLVAGGADIIELGVPFSDPMAEGPVIQQAHERALNNKVGLNDVFACVRKFREGDQETPLVLMGYANPIEKMGYNSFAQNAQEAGVDGVLTVDLPHEEALECGKFLRQYALDNIFLLTPTTTQTRAQDICKLASGYLYYVSLKGVTGANHIDVDDVKENYQRLSTYTDIPICVGFGINHAQAAKSIADFASGVVIGSALIKELLQADEQARTGAALAERARVWLQEIRTAIDT